MTGLTVDATKGFVALCILCKLLYILVVLEFQFCSTASLFLNFIFLRGTDSDDQFLLCLHISTQYDANTGIDAVSVYSYDTKEDSGRKMHESLFYGQTVKQHQSISIWINVPAFDFLQLLLHLHRMIIIIILFFSSK